MEAIGILKGWPVALHREEEDLMVKVGTDEPDLAEALAGDERAFGRIVERHQHAVGAWLHRFTRDQATLEELTQDVFVEAYCHLASFQGRSSLRTWLLSIATRVGYGYWRRLARDRKAREELQKWEWPESEEPSEAAQALFGLLQELPPPDRLVLTLMYFEELSVKEIQQMTGWSASRVKVRAYRARSKLKDLLVRRGLGRDGNE